MRSIVGSPTVEVYFASRINHLAFRAGPSSESGVYYLAMKTFLSIFNAFPSILQAVQAVEVAVPLSKAGQQKMDLILGAAATAWELSQIEQQLSKNNTLNAVQAIANLTVASLNASGVFKPTAPPAPVSSN